MAQEIIDGKNSLVTFRIKRCPEGLELYFKSKVFEDFFKARHYGTLYDSSRPTWGQAYTEQRDALLPGLDINKYGSDKLFFDAADRGGNTIPVIQLSFLRAVGLSEGKTFKVTGVYSRDSIKKYELMFKEQIRSLYEQFVKPIDLTVEVITREVTNNE